MVLVYGGDVIRGILICALTAIIAYLQIGMVKIVRQKAISRFCFVLFVIINNIFLVIDCFLYFSFHKVFSQDILDIIAETNAREIDEFVSVYITLPIVLTFVVLVFAANYCFIKLSKAATSRFTNLVGIAGLLLSAIGLFVAVRCVIMFALYRNGESVPQFSALTRTVYSSYVLRQRIQAIESLAKLNSNIVSAERFSTDHDSTYIALIIGESYSVYHNPLYGYSKNTTPRLNERYKKGQVVVFDDVVTIDDHTHGAMKSIFSLSERGKDFDNMPLFPAIFRAAGYRVSLFDNQYAMGRAVTFLSSPQVSSALFDCRNSKSAALDDDFVDMWPVPEDTKENQLVIYHLMGQHYTYTDRYPTKGFDKFSPVSYAGKTEEEKKKKAEYDNAVYYNDYVVDKILKQLEDKKACVVYLSDHGEEIYDQSSYLGHGNAAAVSDLRYQIRIPLFIWMSDAYKQAYSKQWEQANKMAHTPVFSDDLSHLLIDLAQIHTKYLVPERSIFNSKYDMKRHRIVLNSIDYDAIKFDN